MEKKNKWASNLGFILATAGSAIGLGNLWKFPYLMGKNGGFQFLVAYLFFIIVLGLPIMLTELSIGRMTGKSPIKAYENLNKKAKIIGILGVTCAFIILSYYSVIGGWIMKYIISYAAGSNVEFATFIAEPVQPVIFHLIFMLLAGIICYKGTKGIESASKLMMPGLFILLIIIVIRSLTLEGAGEGVRFIFSASSSKFKVSSISAALGQVFYSLSLCMGITITYGSYLDKKENIPKNAVMIGCLDTFVAILAGLAIFPAVFAFGLQPTQGPSLTFGTLPRVFDSIYGGRIFALAFFVLMFFAALTSGIALLESVIAAVLDSGKEHSRGKTTLIITTLVAVLGIPSALSFGVFSDITILNYSVFDFMGMLTDNIIMPIGGILMCLFVGWIYGPERIVEHIEASGIRFPLKKAWICCIKYVTPVLVVLITIMGFYDVYRIVTQ